MGKKCNGRLDPAEPDPRRPRPSAVGFPLDLRKMASRGRARGDPPAFKQTGKPILHSQPGPSQKKQTEIFIGNLPPDVTDVEIAIHFKDFGIKSVRKFNSQFKCYSFVELISPGAAQLAIQTMNGALWRGRRIIVSMKEDRRGHESTPKSAETPGKTATKEKGQATKEKGQATKEKVQATRSPQNSVKVPGKKAMKEDQPSHESAENLPEMPALEPVPWEELWMSCGPALKRDAQTSPSVKPKVHYAVPMEMRSLFLLQMSKDCFKGPAWLLSVAETQGKVVLLVMDTIPQTPYFWAIHLTQECYQNMTNLFTALAEVESQLPFLGKQGVWPGKRCLAECHVGDEGNAWNRCWVLDRGEDLAVVFFVDFGCSATVPLNSLRDLDDDKFWDIGPLARPFELQGDVFPREEMRRQPLEGTVVGPSEREPHILRFRLQEE